MDKFRALIVDASLVYAKSHGVRGCELLHVCSTACKFVKVNVRGDVLYVCKVSRKVHACGRLCNQGVEMESGTACRLTGMVTVSQKFVHSVSFAPVRGKGANAPIIHWGYGSRIRRKSKHKGKSKVTRGVAMTEAMIVRMVTTLFCSASRDKICTHNIIRKQSSMIRDMRDCLHAHKYIPIQVIMRQTMLIRKLTVRVAPSNLCILEISKAICSYWNANCWLSCTGSPHNVIACLVNFLSHGMYVRGVCMFPVVAWMRRFSPSDTEYGGIPSVQCRAMSATTRLIKGYLVTSVGTPRIDTAFSLLQNPLRRGDTSVI